MRINNLAFWKPIQPAWLRYENSVYLDMPAFSCLVRQVTRLPNLPINLCARPKLSSTLLHYNLAERTIIYVYLSRVFSVSFMKTWRGVILYSATRNSVTSFLDRSYNWWLWTFNLWLSSYGFYDFRKWSGLKSAPKHVFTKREDYFFQNKQMKLAMIEKTDLKELQLLCHEFRTCLEERQP